MAQLTISDPDPSGLLSPTKMVDTAETSRIASPNRTLPGSDWQSNAVTQSVSPESTVSGQMEGLLSSNNPLGKMAETEMKQYYNSRGLLNSGKAAKDTMLAKWQALTPIAQQDANTNFQQSLTNQGYQNTDYFKEVDYQNQRAFSEITQNFQKELTNLNYDNNMQGLLVSAMNSMITNNTALLGKLAASPDVTEEEYGKVRDSIINGLQTFTNIWQTSANDTTTFDFSGIA